MTDTRSNILPESQRFDILIVDNVVSNAGDAAIVLAMKSSLEEAFGPGAAILNCFCGSTSDPGVYGDLYPDLNFTRTLWHCENDWSIPKWNILGRVIRKSAAVRFPLQARLFKRGLPLRILLPNEWNLFQLFANCDLIVVTGGAPLCTSWTPASLRRLRVAQYNAALILGKPLVFYSQSFGPFAADDDLPVLLKPVMEQALAILCRDAASVEVVQDVIGVKADNIHQTIDEALLIEPRQPSRELARPRSADIRIGLCVHQWNWFGETEPVAKQRDFERRIAKVCERLLAVGQRQIVMLTTHQNIPAAMHSDEEVSDRIFEHVSADLRHRVSVVREFVHPCEFAQFMGECDIVLTSRLHGGILSLVGGAPIVALEYEPKTRGLMRQLGIEDWVLSMGESTTDEIVAKVEEILGDLPKARRRQSEAMAVGKRLAMRSREIVLEAFKQRQMSGSVDCDK